MTVYRQNQISNHTEVDRTPGIFRTVASLYPKIKILSFGCSTGEEVRTLKEKYFRDAIIHGIDINAEIIKENVKSNLDPDIKYFSQFDDLSDSYDIIFCMSVLCRWPEGQENYSFEEFEESLNDLDAKLKLGGVMVLYNSQYTFQNSILSRRYIPMETPSLNSGFVTRLNRDFSVSKDKTNPVIFKKIKDKEVLKKYGVLWASTINLGDDIQTIAGINFLEKKGLSADFFVNREGVYDSVNEFTLLMNGWWMHDINNFPPPDNITPLFLSFHCSDERLIERNVEYFKKYQPIGCRDIYTANLFKRFGVEAYFTGCLTLYFDPNYEKSGGKYIADINTCPYIPLVDFNKEEYSDYKEIRHDIVDNSMIFNLSERLGAAHDILAAYSSAEMVITSRLHAALPCRAFRTPVKFVHANLTDNRFSGLESILGGANCVHDAKSKIEEELLIKISDGFDRLTI